MNFDQNIYIENIEKTWQDDGDFGEKQEEYSSIYDLSNMPSSIASINLEVWRTSDHQVMFPISVIEGNSLVEQDIARFGLFIPKELEPNVKFSYNNFVTTDGSYKRTELHFRLTEEAQFLEKLKRENINLPSKNINNGLYVPDQCKSYSEPCATVLTSHYDDMKFFIRHVEILKLKMKVHFLGDNLKTSIKQLSNVITSGKKKNNQTQYFLVLHWTPSEIIDGIYQFDDVGMPKCELYKTPKTSCKYEANSIATFFNDIIPKKSEPLRTVLT